MAATPTTPARNRRWLVSPIPADEAMGYGGELEAVQAVYNAYMAMNAAGVRTGLTTPYGTGQESALAYEDGPQAPMSLLAKAGRAALARVPGVGDVGARTIWHHMVDNASGAQWNYDLWIKGEI